MEFVPVPLYLHKFCKLYVIVYGVLFIIPHGQFFLIGGDCEKLIFCGALLEFVWLNYGDVQDLHQYEIAPLLLMARGIANFARGLARRILGTFMREDGCQQGQLAHDDVAELDAALIAEFRFT